jgi:YD repeat-containing protein
MTPRLLLCFAVLTVALADCRKKNDPAPGSNPGGNTNTPRLTRVTNESGQLTAEYGYGTDKKLVSVKQYTPGSSLPTRTEDYAYDAQGRLERVDVTTAIGNILTRSQQALSYNAAGKIETMNTAQVVGTSTVPTSQNTFEYDGSGRVTRVNLRGANGNGGYTLSSYDTYTYDGRGNVSKIESFLGNNQTLSRLSYEYDDKPNPFRAVGRLQFSAAFLSPNNATREKYEYLNAFTGPSPNYDRALNYQYNAAGYPTQVTQDGIVSKYQYE